MATKRLAMERGLVQRRHRERDVPANAIQSAPAVSAVIKQVFDFLVVLDFESTCWEAQGGTPKPEIIEFPAVLLSLHSGEVVAEFQQYVKPQEQPVLSPFCTSLTGITQQQVDAGVPLGTCLHLFRKWLNQLCEQHQLTFTTTRPGHLVAFATWTDWDLGTCLKQECKRKNLDKPSYFNQWADIKRLYREFYKRKPQGLAGALQDLGLTFQGRQHSGLCDARNTATLITRMARDGCVLTVTKTLGPEAPCGKTLSAHRKKC